MLKGTVAMDDKSWNDYLYGTIGVRTGGVMNEIGLQTASKPPSVPAPRPSRPALPPQSVGPHVLAPYNPVDVSGRKNPSVQYSPVATSPSTAAYWKWWERFASLDDRLQHSARVVGGGAILTMFASFVVLAVWDGTVWADYAGVAIMGASAVIALSLFAMYVARVLEEFGAGPIQTWTGLADCAVWAKPFVAIYASVQFALVAFLLLGPPVGLWLAARWFGWT